MSEIRSLVAALADRGRPRTEAMVQADVRRLLIEAPLGLDEDQVVVLEAPVEGRRRIDVEVGYTVIEVKKDLRPGRVLADAEVQLAGYVQTRTLELGQRYVGVLTDGAEWRAYHLRDGVLVEVATLVVSPTQPDVDELLVWLEGVLATSQGLQPTPSEITRRLGAASPSHALDRETLHGLYAAHGQLPSVQLKRLLWARLLTSALGAQFEDSDELFLEHTLLVNTAEIIAHAVVGLDVATLSSASLLSGRQFELAGIAGVVEADFFDWVLEVPGGESFVRTIARRLGRFDWGNVEHDVLKVLYESVISAETRRKLGEYYTPEWLAEQMVATVVTKPLRQRVLDPACGSGTFLFHTVRSFLAAAEEAGMPLTEALDQLTDHVLGVDLHPVAVAFARVTYLLAIGRPRLTNPTRGPIDVPVYLGDSMQWQQRLDLLTAEHLVIPADDQVELFASELRFPDHLLADAGNFNRLVTELADLASNRPKGAAVPKLAPVFRRLAIHPDDQPTITDTFEVLCRLHDEGRDHIWGYFVRNLARPLWLSRLENRVDVLIGNPPWLAYRNMTADMQKAFRTMCASRGLWHGAAVATQQDLSALFIARTAQLYLRAGGRFAFVMPNAALDRRQFSGFRTGNFPDPIEPTSASFELPWDLRRLRPHFFPRAASVVFGRRNQGNEGTALPVEAERWTGRLARVNGSWNEVQQSIARTIAPLEPGGEEAKSPYHTRFANGATVFPRVLFLVEDQPATPLGLAVGGHAVRSAHSAYEKPPWRDVERLEGVVEADFVRPLYLGENVLPFRLLQPKRCVVPWDGTQLMDGESPRIDLYPRLAAWWRRAERLWLEHRSSERLTLREQLDYRRKFSGQFPAPAQRVVYSASGMHLVAARVTDPTAVIEHALYWGAVSSDDEALYLCAVLNSPRITELVRPLMSYGKDERHIDTAVWRLPIPLYDPDNEHHVKRLYATKRGERPRSPAVR
jgi:SAM-dependent methyltransferase